MNREKKIFLFAPPVSLEKIYGGLAKTGAFSPPLNLLLLGGILRNEGFVPTIIDSPSQGLTEEGIIKIIENDSPHVVGITAMTPHIICAGNLANRIKERFSEILILLGGAHISSEPMKTMERFPSIDVGFVGEADKSLVEFLSELKKGQPLPKIKGTIIREDKKVLFCGERQDTINLDSLPFPAWDLLKDFPQGYPPPLFSAQRFPSVPIITSRGCPGKCIFCFSGCHKTIATHSAEYIFEMLLDLRKKFKIREFMVYDDNFVMFSSNLKRLLKKIIEGNMDLTWVCNARVDMVNQELLELMAKSGCRQISYGIESGNQEILNRIGKNVSKEKVREAIWLTKKVGIRTVGYFMIGHFGESKNTIMETMEFARSSGLDDFRLSYFTPMPGTKSYEIAQEFGRFEDDWNKMTLFSPVFFPKGLSERDLRLKYKIALRRFFFRPKIILGYFRMVGSPVLAIKGALALGRYLIS
ncbi:MAG: radical SAM protein [Candidatus Riflebacteria bacterium]|nr:radical SAM protein [Candidatus Riflebacteria bacterium]